MKKPKDVPPKYIPLFYYLLSIAIFYYLFLDAKAEGVEGLFEFLGYLHHHLSEWVFEEEDIIPKAFHIVAASLTLYIGLERTYDLIKKEN